ncbi:serine/threonine protein kinase, partial [Thermoflavimicrobium dichotomicum]
LVFKLYSPNNLDKLQNEYTAYLKIGNHPRFTQCYFKGKRYLVLKYERGPTLYECLEQGIVIPKQVIQDVEDARNFARSVGLFPTDIHLKNVILQNGRAKLIDVSKYIYPNEDKRWEHLVEGYKRFYWLIRGKKIPIWLLELVKKTYLRQVSEKFSVEDFGKQFMQMYKNN